MYTLFITLCFVGVNPANGNVDSVVTCVKAESHEMRKIEQCREKLNIEQMKVMSDRRMLILKAKFTCEVKI